MNYSIDIFSNVGQLSSAIPAIDRKDKDSAKDKEKLLQSFKHENIKMTYEQRLEHVERLAKHQEQNISELVEERKSRMSRSSLSEADLRRKLIEWGQNSGPATGVWFQIDEFVKAKSEIDLRGRRSSF